MLTFLYHFHAKATVGAQTLVGQRDTQLYALAQMALTSIRRS